ncbi:MAG: branched-chain amino acid ABC transporter permease [Proteobacteria bacterium]|nr:branched-chain amino acid ABC transporter permease [Pseudomonadota bacterium]MBI3497285.1 branched-chain amino acid ABC transporter permease [Pseudomonadota bacterium]
MLVALSIIIDGVAYGMILFMISVGLSVTMGLMRIMNLAHGGFALIGGAIAHALTVRLGIDFVPAAILSIMTAVLISFALERIVYRPIYRLGELGQVLATIGVTFIIIAIVNFFLGSTLLPIRPPSFMTGSVTLGFKTLPMHRLIVIGAGAMVLVFLYWLIERTRFGIYLRASVDNHATAAALGINTSKIYAVTFALGAGLAALGGMLGAELLPLEAYYPLRYMVLFLTVVAVGGLGTITGSFAAAMGLGILDTGSRYLLSEFGTIVFFLAVMLLLSARPRGLLGRA